MKKCQDKRSIERRATLLVAVLVCLLVSTSLAVLGIQRSLRHRRETQTLLLSRQAEWLLEAGMMRAIQQLRDSDNYQGETWKPQGPLTQRFEVSVTIRVQADPNNQSQSIITTIAKLRPIELSDDSAAKESRLGSVRRSYQFNY